MTNHEIADIIVLELVNEREFMERIQPYVKTVVHNPFQTNKLKDAILEFQKSYANHTFKLATQNFDVARVVTIEILKHYWGQHTSKDFDERQDIPPHYYQACKNPKEPKQPHDAALDANNYIWASEQLRQSSRMFRPNTQQIHKQPEGDPTMNAITKIETVTFINNMRADEMSDDQIFSLITQIEKDVAKLEAIEEKPKKLEAKIKAMKESVIELGKIVDSRD